MGSGLLGPGAPVLGRGARAGGHPGSLGSTLVIWGLAFVLGLQCGIEGAYFNRSVGAPAYAVGLPPGVICAKSSRTPSAT